MHLHKEMNTMTNVSVPVWLVVGGVETTQMDWYKDGGVLEGQAGEGTNALYLFPYSRLSLIQSSKSPFTV